jgi:anti-sigma B factor antagonist
MDQISLESSREGDRIVIALAGELDLASASGLVDAARTALAGPGVSELHIDLSQVTFVDSTGLGALVEVNSSAAAQEKRFVLLNPAAQARKLLRTTNVESTLTIEYESDTPDD